MSIDMSLVKFHCMVISTSFWFGYVPKRKIVLLRDFAALMLPGTHNSGAYDVNFGVSKNAIFIKGILIKSF